jgi:SAM-dependent methyltransferase
MSDWRILLAKNCIKAAVPFKHQARVMRAKLTRSPVPDYQTSVIMGAYEQTGALREVGFSLKGKLALEIGSGWHPILPLMFRLAGCAHVALTDVHALLQRESIKSAVGFLRKHKAEIVRDLPVSEEDFEKILGVDLKGTLEDMLTALGLSYHVITDGWRGIPPVDVIFSHTCLEHIAPDQLRRIFKEARTHLKPGGVMSHGIDHTDHRANRDRHLSRIDFLRYSDNIWNMLCVDPQDYCNRLRHSDYLALFAETRFEIVHEEIGQSEEMAADAGKLPLWGRFAKMDMSDLATAWTHFVARPIRTDLAAKMAAGTAQPATPVHSPHPAS